jgi:hypothetical protein
MTFLIFKKQNHMYTSGHSGQFPASHPVAASHLSGNPSAPCSSDLSIQLGGAFVVPSTENVPVSAGLSSLSWTTVISINLQSLTKMYLDVVSQIEVLRGLTQLEGSFALLDAQRKLADVVKGEVEKISNDNAILQSKIGEQDSPEAMGMSLSLLDARVSSVTHQLSCVWSAVYDTPRLAGLAQDFCTLNNIPAPRPLSAYSVTIGETEQSGETATPTAKNLTPVAVVPPSATFASVVARSAQTSSGASSISEVPKVLPTSAPPITPPKALAPRVQKKTQDHASLQQPRLGTKKPAPQPQTTPDGWTTVGATGDTSRASRTSSTPCASEEPDLTGTEPAQPTLAPLPQNSALSSPSVTTPEVPNSLNSLTRAETKEDVQPNATSPAAPQKPAQKPAKKGVQNANSGKGATKKGDRSNASGADDDAFLAQAMKQADAEREIARTQRMQRMQKAAPLVAVCRQTARDLYHQRLEMIDKIDDLAGLLPLSLKVKQAIDHHQLAIQALEQEVFRTYPTPPNKGSKNEAKRRQAIQKLQDKKNESTETIPRSEIKARLRQYAGAEQREANNYAELFASENFENNVAIDALMHWTLATEAFETLFLSN